MPSSKDLKALKSIWLQEQPSEKKSDSLRSRMFLSQESRARTGIGRNDKDGVDEEYAKSQILDFDTFNSGLLTKDSSHYGSARLGELLAAGTCA
jgi:hypothetical protein